MSKIILAAVALLLTAGAASAQTTPATPAPMAPMASMASSGLTLDTPIEQIVANPAGKAVLDKDIPGLTTHPSYDQFKGMSLKQVQPYSDGKLTDAMLTTTATDLAALPK